MVDIKDQSNAIVHGMFVDTVNTLYKEASHPCQEGRLFVTVQYLKSLLSWGFSC